MHETGKEDCIMINLQDKLCNTKEPIKMVLANLTALVSKIVLCYLSFSFYLCLLCSCMVNGFDLRLNVMHHILFQNSG